MKLFVDDIRNAPDDTWHVARTALEAIRAINRFDFEEISLDHDISHQIHLGTMSRPFRCEESFASVAYFIAEKYAESKERPKITLHTSNQVAGDEMALVLRHFSVQKKYMGAANRLEMEV